MAPRLVRVAMATRSIGVRFDGCGEGKTHADSRRDERRINSFISQALGVTNPVGRVAARVSDRGTGRPRFAQRYTGLYVSACRAR